MDVSADHTVSALATTGHEFLSAVSENVPAVVQPVVGAVVSETVSDSVQQSTEPSPSVPAPVVAPSDVSEPLPVAESRNVFVEPKAQRDEARSRSSSRQRFRSASSSPSYDRGLTRGDRSPSPVGRSPASSWASQRRAPRRDLDVELRPPQAAGSGRQPPRKQQQQQPQRASSRHAQSADLSVAAQQHFVDKLVSESGGVKKFKHVDGALSDVLILPAGFGIRNVKVYNVPFECPNEAIARKLGEFGTVLSVENDVWPAGFRPAQLPREAVDNTTYAGALVGAPSLTPPDQQVSAAPAAVAPVSETVPPPTVVVPPVMSGQSLPAARTPREVRIADLPAVSVPDVPFAETSEMLVASPRPISVPAPPTDKRKLPSQPGPSTAGEADASSAESEVSQVSTQSVPADPKSKRKRSKKRSKTAPTEGVDVTFEQAVEGLTDTLVQERRDAPFVHGPPVSVPATPASRAIPDTAPAPSDTMQWSEDVEENHFF
ncbi:fibrous sheath CABYR-binding protein-like [Schistocerca cancellata]|uniref:fibrous sheath CABYR-binding protein-like n=1 Tax=Schistocerca cancellata TaxID=274614 RepID=UPI002117503B|nr:fibrous sheath CABYR-binding protein-like [Schistocerca cancellata]